MTEQFFEQKNNSGEGAEKPEDTRGADSMLTIESLTAADGHNPLLGPTSAKEPGGDMTLDRLKGGDDMLLGVEPASTRGAEAYERELSATIRIQSSEDAYGERSRFSKIVDIGTGAVLDSPGEYYRQLKSDITNQPLDVATNAAIGTGIGLGATGLLKVAPKKGKLALGALLAGQALHYGANMVDFFSEAADAKSTFERDMFVRAGSRGLAREGVHMTEAMPGILAGGYAGTRLFGKPQLFVETQQYVNRKWAFNGPGSRNLDSSIKHPDGRIDMLALDDAIGGARLDTSLPYETARSVDLLNMRLSKPIKGSNSKLEVDLGFRDREAFLRQHTQPDKSQVGHLPSYRDIEATRHVGIINSGDKTTFYVGKMQEYEGLVQAGVKPSEIKLPAQGIVLDRSGSVPTATLFETQAVGPASGHKLIFENRVDFAEAERILKSLDIGQAWQQMSSLGAKTR